MAPTPPESYQDKAANRGFRHLLNATRFTVQGLKHAIREEAAFRQELALLAVVVPVAVVFGRSPLEVAILVTVYALVLVVELMNSAVEAVVDLVSPDFHELAGRAKDLGSAAVGVALVLAGSVWAAFLWEVTTGVVL